MSDNTRKHPSNSSRTASANNSPISLVSAREVCQKFASPHVRSTCQKICVGSKFKQAWRDRVNDLHSIVCSRWFSLRKSRVRGKLMCEDCRTVVWRENGTSRVYTGTIVGADGRAIGPCSCMAFHCWVDWKPWRRDPLAPPRAQKTLADDTRPLLVTCYRQTEKWRLRCCVSRERL